MLVRDEISSVSEAVEPLLVADFETRQVKAVSDSLARLFGSGSEELVNSKLDSIIAIPDRKKTSAHFLRLLKEEVWPSLIG